MRQPYDGAFQHVRVVIQGQLYLNRINVEPARDHQILGAPHDLHIAVGIDLPQIAGDKPAIGPQFFAGFFGHLPVACKDIGAPHFYPAHSALCHFGPVRHDPQLHPRQREPHSARTALALIRVRGVHIGFRHPIAFQNALTGAVLKLAVGIGQQRGRAGYEQPHMRRQRAVKPRIFQQARVKRWHAHQGGCLRQQAQHRFHIKPRQEDHLPPRQQTDV